MTLTLTITIKLIEHSEFLFDAKNRHEYSYRRSKGIVVGWKRFLKDYVSIVYTDSKYVHWLNSVEDLISVIVYMLCGNAL